MSKFLKIIVNLTVLFAIAITAALLVPPFIGVNTVMNDNTEVDTNVPVGSVAYGQPTKISELKKGDRIILKEGASTYIYEAAGIDTATGVCTVKDVYNKNSEEKDVALQSVVPKVIVTIPFIGYAAMALQSKEGLIVIGLGIVLLIILFILSEVFRKDDDDDEDDDEYDDEEYEDDDDDEYEEDDDEDEEEEKLSRKERRRLKKEEKRRRKMAKKGYSDDDDEDDDEEEEDISESETIDTVREPEGYDDAMKEAISSIAMGVAKASEPEQTPDATIVMPELNLEITDEFAEMEELDILDEENIQTEAWEAENDDAAEESINIEESAEIEEEKPVFNTEAILQPTTVQELLKKAQAAGEEPEVREDKDNKVTLLDYSDIL